jgi:AcrR family transcriptional regulator
MTVAARRIGAEGSATRALILAATEQVMLEEGYAAASTRRVAARAGLKPSLVHYYFPTTEDLLLAVNEKGAAESDRRLEEALAADDPLRALWRLLTDSSQTALALETMALANHRKAIRTEIARHVEEVRARQVEALTALLGERMAPFGGSPEALSVVLTGIGRALIMERALGVSDGHTEAAAWVERLLDSLTAPRESRSTVGASSTATAD